MNRLTGEQGVGSVRPGRWRATLEVVSLPAVDWPTAKGSARVRLDPMALIDA